MGNAQKALIMAAGFFLAIALITIAVVMFISAQDATKAAQNNFSDIQTELSQTAYTVYDNTVVSGSQVVNALRKFADKEQFGIQVKTGKNMTGSWYTNVIDISSPISNNYGSVVSSIPRENINYAAVEAHIDYVNPSGKFKAKIIKDKSNVIRGIEFSQQ
ncbi:ABC transporter permease [Paenibacillus lutrae]|uniref:ABC transporter permease n=1 Tax=Paenibacillus lutrae TaxID=2078573 RepID=A0A7X3JYM7_9BACL|nr:ABC transporter permease [Paenibacillus lutrae]MVO99288.1 ABC transporter permease [Paenibacillus lutrae]